MIPIEIVLKRTTGRTFDITLKTKKEIIQTFLGVEVDKGCSIIITGLKYKKPTFKQVKK